MAKSTAMPTNSTPNPTETRLSVPTATVANSTVSISPSTSVIRIGTMSRHERTARNSHSVISTRTAHQTLHGPLSDGREFFVGQRHLPGDAHPRVTRFHERQLGDDVAHRLRRRSSRLQRADNPGRGCTSTKWYGPASWLSPPPSNACHDSGFASPVSASVHSLIETLLIAAP